MENETEHETPTLVVSDPPHGEVDLQAAADLLKLDVFLTGLKAKFAAPEVMSASRPDKAEAFAAALREAGFTVATLDGAVLADLPWPDPVSFFAFDDSCVRATVRGETIEVAYDTPAVAVYCRPPKDFTMESEVDLEQALTSGHGPMIAEAIQWMESVDLYFREGDTLRRISILPELLGADGDSVAAALESRFRGLHLDSRLVGVRPRARFVMGESDWDPDQRKRYSFGTLLLRHVMESIQPELRDITQYELGSRLAYALRPTGSDGG